MILEGHGHISAGLLLQIFYFGLVLWPNGTAAYWQKFWAILVPVLLKYINNYTKHGTSNWIPFVEMRNYVWTEKFFSILIFPSLVVACDPKAKCFASPHSDLCGLLPQRQ